MPESGSKRLPRPRPGQPTLTQMAALTGIDFVRGMATGRLPGAPIAELANIRLTEVREGEVVFEGEAGFEHYNPMGAVHGGWFGIALDSAMGCAVMTRVPRGHAYTTLEYKVSILRPVFDTTGPLRIVGRSLHAGKRTATAEGRIEDASGRLYATGSTTCLVIEIDTA